MWPEKFLLITRTFSRHFEILLSSLRDFSLNYEITKREFKFYFILSAFVVTVVLALCTNCLWAGKDLLIVQQLWRHGTSFWYIIYNFTRHIWFKNKLKSPNMKNIISSYIRYIFISLKEIRIHIYEQKNTFLSQKQKHSLQFSRRPVCGWTLL